jgi:hypothetical protein
MHNEYKDIVILQIINLCQDWYDFNILTMDFKFERRSWNLIDLIDTNFELIDDEKLNQLRISAI